MPDAHEGDGIDEAIVGPVQSSDSGPVQTSDTDPVSPATSHLNLIVDLTEGELIDLTEPDPARPVSGRPLELVDGHRVVTITGGDLWMAAEAFVYDLYFPIGYCEPSPLRRVEELARWSDISRFHAILNREDVVIGTVRNIFGVYDELPVGQFQRTDHRDPDPVCELSSLTVHRTVRSTGVIEHLYRSAWLDAFRSGSSAVVALIDEWLFDLFRDVYRLPFAKIGIGAHYMGSDPFPVAMPLVGEAYLPVARDNPEFWAWTLEAIAPEEIEAWGLPVYEGNSVRMSGRYAGRARR